MSCGTLSSHRVSADDPHEETMELKTDEGGLARLERLWAQVRLGQSGPSDGRIGPVCKRRI